jgi:hypothetical protein
MTILFDLSASQPIHKSDFHGGSEYCKTVFISLCEKISDSLAVDVFFNQGKHLDPRLQTLCTNLKLTAFDCKCNRDVDRILSNKKYDVFYSALPYSYTNITIPPETMFVYTIHGLRALEFPWDCYTLKYKKPDRKIILKYVLHQFFPKFFLCLFTKRNLHNFSKLFSRTKNQTIITVSEHSKHSLSFFFPNNSLIKTKIFYSPYKQAGPIESDESNILSFYKIKPKRYILMICGDRNEKGAYRACKAIACHLIKKNPVIPADLKIIVVGVTYSKHYKLVTHNSDSFIFLEYIPSEHLEIFYKNAHLFLYPTLNEGFGYPPLEAMKYGTLCACSANSAVTEICSDAVLYFNPFDETEICIRTLQSFDNDIYNEKRERMSIQYNKIHERQENDLKNLIQLLINQGPV